ncbi:hypothetical protein G647_00167 [Cladophialophora carrionii CBS 160.54]|uniref:FAD-binding domain-containing protein n=1 Tax=Cladophialophora carrionii CBS 160.54 TaxID=1279043 RepID=V9DN25_9EURO|nr:uncharacterized protein G647_00167 [Cladophialophora carrionii CBS 160.54]ETI27718.1 hypothetical protein G647_00167 [Cladophialophora carrionii CBS 160.54]
MPHIQLNVIVAGGGIAGLTAALALRRQGHAVTVVESSAWLREAGLAVAVPPNATRALIGLGIEPKRDAKAAAFRTSLEYHFLSKDTIPRFGEDGDSRPLTWARRAAASHLKDLFFLAHRIDLHNALKDKCTSPAGPGKPVEVLLSSRAVSWDPTGSIKLQDGREMHADLIVAADGIHSVAHEAVLGYRVPATPSGVSTMRFLLRTEDILNDPATAHVMDDGPGSFTFYVNADRSTYLVRYPCHNDEMQNFGAYTDPGNNTTVVGEKVSRALLLERLSTLPPVIQALGRKADDYVFDWKIADREPLPTYHKDRLVLVGDAAHPMWPRQGQGAAQSIEDAATLGILMSQLEDEADIPKRLALYDELRVPRTSIVQQLSHSREEDRQPQGPEDADMPLSEEFSAVFRKFSTGATPPGMMMSNSGGR